MAKYRVQKPKPSCKERIHQAEQAMKERAAKVAEGFAPRYLLAGGADAELKSQSERIAAAIRALD